jgi:hypothetical protein
MSRESDWIDGGKEIGAVIIGFALRRISRSDEDLVRGVKNKAGVQVRGFAETIEFLQP